MTTAVLEPPPRASRNAGMPQRPRGLADRLIVEVATAPDVRAGIGRLIAVLRRSGLERVEWWAPTGGSDSVRLELSDGNGGGTRTEISLGPAGVLLLFGAARLTLAVTRVVPLLRRRWTEEQLATHVTLLARQNEALEDFAALVAHEVRSSLYAALRQTGPSTGVEDALALVDSILEIARTESASGASAPVAQCLEEALDDLGLIDADVVADLPATLPMPPAALRLLLRNLIGNALAAGARHIRVSAVSTTGQWTLHVDDDGVGLEAPTGYATGARLGFNLCRRLAARLGGVLELNPRPCGGTCASLVLTGGA